MYVRKKTFFVLRSAAAAFPLPFFWKMIFKKKEKEKKILGLT